MITNISIPSSEKQYLTIFLNELDHLKSKYINIVKNITILDKTEELERIIDLFFALSDETRLLSREKWFQNEIDVKESDFFTVIEGEFI